MERVVLDSVRWRPPRISSSLLRERQAGEATLGTCLMRMVVLL
jgi:hypothetical protein